MDAPQDQAQGPKVIIDPSHPEAGCGGVVPPVATRWKPGQSGHPGGRKRGASIVHEIERRLAEGAEFDEQGELVRVGIEARAIAQALIEVSRGQRDPSEIDVKAALAIMERVDGAVIKERVNTNTHVVQGITLEDRRKDAPPVPGTESK